MSDFDHFVGTRPVTGAHTIDVDSLSAWLESHLEGFKGPLSLEIFKGGQSNPTYKLNLFRFHACMFCAKTNPSSDGPFT